MCMFTHDNFGNSLVFSVNEQVSSVTCDEIALQRRCGLALPDE